MKRKWILESQDSKVVAGFMESHKLMQPIAIYLSMLGFTSDDDVIKYLHPHLEDLSSPYDLENMQTAVDRIAEAIQNNERILIFGDYDVDGVTSTALMVRAIKELGGNVTTYIPNRQRDGYGFNAKVVESCIELMNPNLIITVDCGVNSSDGVNRAMEMEVDVIVTDHHEPDSHRSSPLTLVNPKISSDKTLHILAGCGVALYVVRALFDKLLVMKTPTVICAWCKYLDFAALGTVADVMPLVGDNRIIVKHGLENVQYTQWKGLTALKEICGIHDKVESQHLGFKIGPRINAAGRVGSAFDALSLLLTDDKDDAMALAVGLDTFNNQRKTIELDTTGKACKIIDATFNPDEDFGLVMSGFDWHTGVVGIVASRLVECYGRPAIVLSILPDGTVKGSCRTIEQFDILQGLRVCSDLLVKFGGHTNAAGLELRVENLEMFKKVFCDYCRQELKGKDLAQSLKICAEIKPSDWGWELYNQIQTLQPFGNKNPEPVWLITDAIVIDSRMLKDVHLKITVIKGGVQMSGIMFNYVGDPIVVGAHVAIAFKLSKNVFNDVASLQMQIIDIT